MRSPCVTTCTALQLQEQGVVMSTSTVTVTGMTCGHCASSVREEVGALAGVSDVEVDMGTGAVTITSTDTIEPAAVKAAVAEAGYQVAE